MWFTDDDRASWAFVEGSISVTASILTAYAIARCASCSSWPIIKFFKGLTELDSGVLIAGMALLFPTALGFYVGVKMVFAAYRGYRKWKDEQLAKLNADLEVAREEGIEKGREEGVEVGREEERERIKKELQEHGILTPEAERILFGESYQDAAD